MTLSHHHAHIFIGEANTVSENLVLEYLREETIDETNAEIHRYSMELFTIDDARELKQLVAEKTKEEDKKLVVIVGTSNFSHPAQHALLKTLEEPHKEVLIIFITPREHTLLPTLKSRVILHYLAGQDIVSPIDTKLFSKGHAGKRLKMVDEYLQKVKDDEALHGVSRKDALSFLDAYEAELYRSGELTKNVKAYQAIFFAKEYLTDGGSSVKQLLEYVALMK